MNFNGTIDYRLLFVNTPKDDPQYKKLTEYFNNTKNKNILEDNRLRIGVNFKEHGNFNMHFYDIGGGLLDNVNNFDEKHFENIINEIKSQNANQEKSFQKGGKRSYKQKYLEAKKDYKELKTAITKLF